jgi:hypothetical protein
MYSNNEGVMDNTKTLRISRVKCGKLHLEILGVKRSIKIDCREIDFAD